MYSSKLTSIICAAYNAAPYIEETIQSILDQTDSNWELIIIDDCSSDNTINIVTKYTQQYSNILLIKNEKNLGPGITRNKGIEKAKGRYIAICDSDDVWFPQKLELQIRFMESQNNIPISYTSYGLIDEKGKDLHKIIRVSDTPLSYSDYLKNTIIGFSTSIIDRQLCPEIKMRDLHSREDTCLWCELLRSGYKAYGINEVLVKYRIHETSLSANKIQSAKLVWKLYRDYLKIPVCRRMYYFGYYAFHAFKKRYLRF